MSKETPVYDRVSHKDQRHASQLPDVECWAESHDAEVIWFRDTFTGRTMDRSNMTKLLDALQLGKLCRIVVWRWDRLGRSVRHLVTLVDELRSRRVGFRSICDGAIDTTTASGKLIFNVCSALAEFERALIQERTLAGFAAARARGRNGGRPRITADHPKVQAAKLLYDQFQRGEIQLAAILKTLNVGRT